MSGTEAPKAIFVPAPGSPFEAGAQPSGITSADFSGDGSNDLAVTNASETNDQVDTISVLLNNGGGLFPNSTPYSGGPSTYGIISADFTGDGSNDLAVTNYYGDGSISVLYNDGSGNFEDPVTHGPVGESPVSIISADFTRNGKPDLAVTAERSNYVSVLYNDGTGGFNDPVTYKVGPYPFGITSADFTGDGSNDLAVTSNTENTVSVLLNDGSGNFGTPTPYKVNGTTPVSIISADFTGDGLPDLAVANNESHNVSVLLNDGSGSFETPTIYDVGNGPGSIISADFTGNGKPDLAVTNNGSTNVSVLLNTT